jgi:hypothetical protein
MSVCELPITRSLSHAPQHTLPSPTPTHAPLTQVDDRAILGGITGAAQQVRNNMAGRISLYSLHSLCTLCSLH